MAILVDVIVEHGVHLGHGSVAGSYLSVRRPLGRDIGRRLCAVRREWLLRRRGRFRQIGESGTARHVRATEIGRLEVVAGGRVGVGVVRLRLDVAVVVGDGLGVLQLLAGRRRWLDFGLWPLLFELLGLGRLVGLLSLVRLQVRLIE